VTSFAASAPPSDGVGAAFAATAASEAAVLPGFRAVGAAFAAGSPRSRRMVRSSTPSTFAILRCKAPGWSSLIRLAMRWRWSATMRKPANGRMLSMNSLTSS
jgi:hypothetical protein